MGWALSMAVLLAAGCGGSAYEYSSAGSADSAGSRGMATGTAPSVPMTRTAGAMEVEQVLAADVESTGMGGGDFEQWDGWRDEEPAAEPPTPDAAGQDEGAPPARPQVAQNQAGGQTGSESDGGGTQPTRQPPQETSDAVDLSEPLLIYTAELHLGVYEVEATQETIMGAVNELGGHLAQRSDMVLVVKVPAQRFQQALDAIEGAGDVIHRNVEVLDVSEEYRDLAIRIRNGEVMRDRLEQLLRQANNVQEALAVERELQRLTESIERMKGRLRFLSDRVSFSTITVRFQALGDETAIQDDRFRLPFPWLDELGLSNLLRL